MGSIPIRGNEIFNIFFCSLWCLGKASTRSATQNAISLEFGGKCGAECLNTRRPLPILHAESNIKLNKKTTDIRIVGQ